MGIFNSVALPVDNKGRHYITDEMIAQHPHLRDFILRTKDGWEYDWQQHIYFAKIKTK